MCSDVVAGGGGGRGGRRGQLPTLNFWLSENCANIFFLLENFHSEVQNLGLEHIWG